MHFFAQIMWNWAVRQDRQSDRIVRQDRQAGPTEEVIHDALINFRINVKTAALNYYVLPQFYLNKRSMGPPRRQPVYFSIFLIISR